MLVNGRGTTPRGRHPATRGSAIVDVFETQQTSWGSAQHSWAVQALAKGLRWLAMG